MASFSERQGLGRKAMQIHEMDSALRNGLWNAIYLAYAKPSSEILPMGSIKKFYEKLIVEILKQPLLAEWTSVPIDRTRGFAFLRKVTLGASWNLVYDIVEFFPNNFPAGGQIHDRFCANVDTVLERERAGYRFIERRLTPITNEDEIQSIETTLSLGGPFDLAAEHMLKAIQLISDRQNPDYSNSIKESISAVEAACKVVADDPKATLGQALKAIDDDSAHPVLREAFIKLYGWTSDGGGIRHAMTDDTKVGFAEAQFMVVACSAFTNYLAAKYAA